jgi:hypothetical protein
MLPNLSLHIHGKAMNYILFEAKFITIEQT